MTDFHETETSPSHAQRENRDSKIIFSPVKTPVSQGDGHRQGNLTGTLRKIKDTAADVHNQLLKWKKLNTDGQTISSEIANIKLENVFSEENESGQIQPLPESLEPLCERLTAVYHNMEKVVSKLQQMRTSVCGLEELVKHKGEDHFVLFTTWTVADFVTTLNELVRMYETEITLKKSIVENIAHTSSRNTMMFYTAAWLHQPYVEHNAQLLLESLLVETGHK